MKRYILSAVAAFAALASYAAPVAPASAQQALLISSGGEKGTYYRLIKELATFCKEPAITNQVSGGSLDNIDAILNNKAELGITQEDALVLRAQKEDSVKKELFTLFPLHVEEIHLVAKAAGKTITEGGLINSTLNIVGAGSSKTLMYNTINDLKGQKVGYWGGTAVTEKVINALALIGWQAIEYPSDEKAIDALKNNQLDAILAVGGQPLAWVEKLDRNYKLLEIPDQVAKQLDATYSKVTLSYRNLGQDGVQTVGVRSLLVTRNYKSKGKVAELTALRDCAIKSIDDIRETRDTHPKWQAIDPSATSKWQMYAPAMQGTAAAGNNRG
ncbi:MAG TPA: TAXI family TRAP transporter solute-binding subunit [Candidatus Paceibacterota bacterium]|jgi:TRAP-type uncharacterized transport system substrate-binding protein|nr:TAXI family TRAP transporter solute-binding subunit [Candidatus Paceibacterota bacterium]